MDTPLFTLTQECGISDGIVAYGIQINVRSSVTGSSAVALTEAVAALRKRFPGKSFQIIPHASISETIQRRNKKVTLTTVER